MDIFLITEHHVKERQRRPVDLTVAGNRKVWATCEGVIYDQPKQRAGGG